MPRQPRIIIPDLPHHVVQRGNNKNQVFFSPDDFELYLALLQKYSEKHHFEVIAYCLMSNHVHLVGIPSSENSMINVIRDTHQKYSLFTNRKLNRCGHFWQERPYIVPCDDHHAVASICYSEMNPVRAGMVPKPEDYRWSSARIHLGLEKRDTIPDSKWWRSSYTHLEWIEIMKSYDNRMDSIIREATVRGLPLGNTEFISMVESRYGVINLTPKMGRPSNSNGKVVRGTKVCE